jgi:hypothetical protein
VFSCKTAAWPHLAKILYLLSYFNRPKPAGKVGQCTTRNKLQLAAADELVAGALEDFPFCGACYQISKQTKCAACDLLLLMLHFRQG